MWLGPRQASNEQHAIAVEVTKTNRTQETRLARRALVGLEHAHRFEEGRVLRVAVAADRIDARINAPHPPLREHLLVRFIIIITVEDHLGHVGVDEVGRDGLGSLTAFDTVRDLCANQPVRRVDQRRAATI